MEGLLPPSTRARLERALAGEDVARRLPLGHLVPGQVGVVEAEVAQAESPRTFTRRDGREGALARIVLRDATGEAALVLWGGQTGLVGSDLLPGASVRLTGIAVKEGYRGAPPELSLDGDVHPIARAAPHGILQGLLELGPTEPVPTDTGPRFRAEGMLQTADGPVPVLLWDACLRTARALEGPVRLEGMAPHPVLDGLWLSTPQSRAVPV